MVQLEDEILELNKKTLWAEKKLREAKERAKHLEKRY
jgi:hypothetical protein